jgi:hypothetical protein
MTELSSGKVSGSALGEMDSLYQQRDLHQLGRAAVQYGEAAAKHVDCQDISDIILMKTEQLSSIEKQLAVISDCLDISYLISYGEELFSMEEQLFSMEEQLFSMDEQLFSMDEQLFSMEEQLFSMEEQLFSMDEQLFSRDEQLFSIK